MPWKWLSFGKNTTTELKEAFGTTIDTLSEPGFRKLTEENSPQIQPHHHERMQRAAIYLWESNLLAKAVIELPLAYILAEGVRLTSPDAKSQKVLDDFWDNPINNLAISLEEIVRATHLSGCLCLPLFVNEFSGAVQVGYLNPYNIQDVILDPNNPRIVIGVITKRDTNGRYKKYRTWIGDDEELFTEQTQIIREQFQDGYCLYMRINNLPDDLRGRSDLLAAADWMDGYDQFMFNALELQNFLRSFIWDVELTGATAEEVQKRANEIKPPAPGSVRIHNESEKWKAEAPDLKSRDVSDAARLFRTHVLGGQTIPEHWFGSGGDVNRATAGEMGEPTFKTLTMRQKRWQKYLEQLGRFVLTQHYQANQITGELPSVFAQFPELVKGDISKNSGAFTHIIGATGAAIANGLLSEETALQLIQQTSQLLGVEFDPTEEIERIQRQKDRKAEEETYAEEPLMQEEQEEIDADTEQ